MSGYASWDTAFEGNSGGGGTAKTEFVKFPEGITKLRVIDLKIHVRWVHWMPQFKRSVNCPGSNKCPICTIRKAAKEANEKQKYSLSKRFAVNVLNRETKSYEILDQGKEFFEDLKVVRIEGLQPIVEVDDDGNEVQKAPRGELTNYDVKVRRTGTGQEDTKYRIDPDRKYALSKEDMELAAGAKDLEEYFKPHTTEQIQRLLNGEEWNEVMSGQATESGNNSNEQEEQVEVE